MQEVIKVRQDSLGNKRLALPSQPDFLGNRGAPTDREEPRCPLWKGSESKASDTEKSLLWLGLLLLPHTGACWDCHKSDEQEAVNRRAGTSVQLANSPPGSFASMVPHRLPVQQLIPETQSLQGEVREN